jgi:hypothetical protein
VLAEDDLAFTAIDLANRARTVACMPALLEAEHIDMKWSARWTSATLAHNS